MIHSFDRDPKLPHLAKCMNAQEMADRLHFTWDGPNGGLARFGKRGSAHAGPPVECRPLSYRAGRRAAIAYRAKDNGGTRTSLVGKTYRDGRAESLLLRHRTLNQQLALLTNSRVRVPAPFDYVPAVNMGIFAWAKGGGPSADGCAFLGQHLAAATEALAAMHRTWIAGLKRFTVENEIAVLKRWYRLLREAHPPLAERAGGLLESILRASHEVHPGPERTIHRDFYDRQILLTKRTTTILDLDTLACGDACVDLGNWLAHLFLGHLRECAEPAYLAKICEGAIGGYEAAAGPVDRRTLAFYCASAAFRVGAVHALRTDTGCFSPKLWDFAADMAAAARNHRSAAGDGLSLLAFRTPRLQQRIRYHECTKAPKRVYIG